MGSSLYKIGMGNQTNCDSKYSYIQICKVTFRKIVTFRYVKSLLRGEKKENKTRQQSSRKYLQLKSGRRYLADIQRNQPRKKREFPGSPALRTPCFHSWGGEEGWVWGTKILQALSHSQREGREKKSEHRI